MKKIILSLVLVLALVSMPAQASIFDDLLQRFTPPQPQQADKQPQVSSLPVQDDFGVFLYGLMKLNIPSNIEKLNTEMQSRGISAIRIHVIEYNQDFYIVNGKGVTGYNQAYDQSYDLTKTQILKIKEIVQDGKITWGERIQIQLILGGIL